MGKTILQVENLTTSFFIQNQYYAAVDNVSFAIQENEIVAIVGESGCGKSALALSIAGLHGKERIRLEGTITYQNINLLTLTDSKLNKIRGKEIGMIFQEPLTALNQLMTVRKQIEENLNYPHSFIWKNGVNVQLLSNWISNPVRVYKLRIHMSYRVDRAKNYDFDCHCLFAFSCHS